MAVNRLWNNVPSVVLVSIYSNLSKSDRLAASSTCRSWRDCLFNQRNWPSKSMKLDLSNKSSVDWRRSKILALKHLLAKCCRFLTGVEIMFNCNCYFEVKDLIDILIILSGCAMEGNRLRQISLKPTSIQLLINYERNSSNDLMVSLITAVESLISRNNGHLEHISFGCMEDLLNLIPSLFSHLAQNSHLRNSLKSLHLSTIKEDPDYYPVHEIPPALLEPLVNLKVLSIDYDYLCDDLLRMLARKPLEKLIINVHGLDDEHPGISKTCLSTSNFNSKFPQLTINILHTDDFPDDLRELILETDIPLSHLRAFFVGDGTRIVELVNLIAVKHQHTLQSLVLVDSLKPHTLQPNAAFAKRAENELVLLAWRCKKLSHLTVIGYEISEVDLIAITRLRGSQLKELVVPACCISLMHSPIAEDEGYYDDDRFYLDMATSDIRSKVIADIAKPLNREWKPLTNEELAKAILDRHHSPDSAYLPLLLEDQRW